MTHYRYFVRTHALSHEIMFTALGNHKDMISLLVDKSLHLGERPNEIPIPQHARKNDAFRPNVLHIVYEWNPTQLCDYPGRNPNSQRWMIYIDDVAARCKQGPDRGGDHEGGVVQYSANGALSMIW